MWSGEAYQVGFLSVLYAAGNLPFELWKVVVPKSIESKIEIIEDEEVEGPVIQIVSEDIRLTYLSCPLQPHISLGIKLPYLNLYVKNLEDHWNFEIQIEDHLKSRRRLCFSTFQKEIFCHRELCCIPLYLQEGWNTLVVNLLDLTFRLYKTKYVQTVKLQIHANIILQRVFFSDKLHENEIHNLPYELRLIKKIFSSK